MIRKVLTDADAVSRSTFRYVAPRNLSGLRRAVMLLPASPQQSELVLVVGLLQQRIWIEANYQVHGVNLACSTMTLSERLLVLCLGLNFMCHHFSRTLSLDLLTVMRLITAGAD